MKVYGLESLNLLDQPVTQVIDGMVRNSPYLSSGSEIVTWDIFHHDSWDLKQDHLLVFSIKELMLLTKVLQVSNVRTILIEISEQTPVQLKEFLDQPIDDIQVVGTAQDSGCLFLVLQRVDNFPSVDFDNDTSKTVVQAIELGFKLHKLQYQDKYKGNIIVSTTSESANMACPMVPGSTETWQSIVKQKISRVPRKYRNLVPSRTRRLLSSYLK